MTKHPEPVDLEAARERVARYDNDPQIWGIKQLADLTRTLIDEVTHLRSAQGPEAVA